MKLWGGRSWSYKMRYVLGDEIHFISICCINELAPEQKSAKKNKIGSLNIPTFILLHMLEFLCYRHVDQMRAQAALNDLQVEVHNGQGTVFVPHRDISWEILGICQQMTGNHQAALYSYYESLTQYPVHKIQSAIIQRILNTTAPCIRIFENVCLIKNPVCIALG